MSGYRKLEIFLHIYQQNLPEVDETWPFIIQKAYVCIIAYLFNPVLKVDWLKEQCYVGSHNFSARFAHFIGYKPKTFINHHRMNAAEAILKDPEFHEILISEIAAKVGVLSVSTFTRSFLRHKGMTPAQWRESQQKPL